MSLADHRISSTLAAATQPLRGVAELVVASRYPETRPSQEPALPAPSPLPGDAERALSLPAPRALEPVQRSLASVIAARRSGRLSAGALDAATLGTLLAAAAARPAGLADATLDPLLFPVIFDVDGVPPGAHRYDRGEHRLAPIGPASRARMAETAILQREHAMGAAVLFLVVPIGRWLVAFGDRGYRGAAFAAGWLTDRLYLVAETLGLTYTATGGFAPAVVDEVLGLDGRDHTAFFAFAVGGHRQPTSREAPRGGQPR